MKLLPIGQLTKSVSTWNPSKGRAGEFTYVDLGAIDNDVKAIIASSRVSTQEAPSRARQLVGEGDVLVSTVRPNLNAVAVVPVHLDGATASTGFTVLRPESSLDARYLFHWVRSPSFVADMVRKATGASYPAVSDRIVKESLIPAPPVEEQRRIAGILDQADALRAKRRQVLAHVESLTQSIFHDMFDGRQTKTTLLGDVAEVVSGITKGRRTVDPTQPFPYLAVANVQAGHLKLDTVKTIDATDSEVSRFALRTGDLVLTEGGDPDKLGRGTVWRGEITTCLHQNHVFRVRLNRDSQVLPEYLSAFLAGREAKSYFLRSAKQTTGIASINMTQLKGLSIVVPPLMDQSRYVERIANINSCVDRAKESLTMHDRLFSALQSRAFRGEL